MITSTALFIGSLRWSVTLSWTIFLTILLVQPEAQTVINTGIAPAPPSFERELFFTTLHLITFGLTTLLWVWVLRGHMPLRNALIIAAVIVLVLGISTEFLQGRIPGRTPQLADLIANSTGMMLGLWFYRRWLGEGNLLSASLSHR